MNPKFVDELLNVLRHTNKIMNPIITQLGNSMIAMRYHPSVGHYYFRPFSLDMLVAQEVFDNIYQTNVAPNDLVIDIGAHIGLFSMYCANKGAIVLAIEPSPENAKILLDNELFNIYSGTILSYQYAVSNHNHEIDLHIYPNQINNSIYGKGKKIKVKCLDIKELSECDILKLDVEGAEYDILSAMDKTMIRKELLVEYHKINGWGFKDLDLGSMKIVSHREFGENGYIKAIP
jgi:FkbM family methyltransferase